MPAYYPALIDLTARRSIVLGGGKVAERKAIELVRAGAKPIVISPAITPRLRRMLKAGDITYKARRFRVSDLKNAFLVIAATDAPEENRLAATCGACLVNVVDDPDYCSFIAPSVIRRGALTLAISTSGTSPALARAIRMKLEKLVGPVFGRYLTLMRRTRARAMREIKDPKARMLYLKSLASADAVDALMKGRLPAIPSMPKKKAGAR